jgi:hypothetical protein
VQTPDAPLPPAAVAALEKGSIIEAIKIVRADRNLGLKEAKDLVDRHLAADPGLRDRARSAGAEGGRGVLLWIALIALAGIVAVLLLRKP